MSKSKEYKYQLLDRLKQDCEYYLGYGNKNPRVLWAGDEKKQIDKMLELYNSFKDSEKPEWLNLDDIKNYAKELNVPIEEEYDNTEKLFRENIDILSLKLIGGYNDVSIFNVKLYIDNELKNIEVEKHNFDMQTPDHKWVIPEDQNLEPKIKEELPKILDTADRPKIEVLQQDEGIKLLKYNHKNTIYSVEMNNSFVGATIYFGLDLEKAKNIYQKEVILESLQKQDNNILCQVSDLSSIVSDGKSKVFVFDDCIYGRRDDIIDYLREEIEQMNNNPAFFDDEQEQEADIKEGIYETLVELEEGKESLEPLYLFVHPQDEHLHLANDKQQLEKYEEFFDKVSEIILENEESEEDEL